MISRQEPQVLDGSTRWCAEGSAFGRAGKCRRIRRGLRLASGELWTGAARTVTASIPKSLLYSEPLGGDRWALPFSGSRGRRFPTTRNDLETELTLDWMEGIVEIPSDLRIRPGTASAVADDTDPRHQRPRRVRGVTGQLRLGSSPSRMKIRPPPDHGQHRARLPRQKD